MSNVPWPSDHPNARILSFIETSRLILHRAASHPAAAPTAVLLRIEALIQQMTVGRTVADVDALVAQVGPLVNEAAARMESLRAHLGSRT